MKAHANAWAFAFYLLLKGGIIFLVGKVVFWIVLTVWLFIGLMLMIAAYRRQDTGSQMEKTPVLMALICLLGGPILLIYGFITGTRDYIKAHKKHGENHE